MKLKSADALPVEDESIGVIPCQISPIRPYVSLPSVNSFSSSGRPQSSIPELDHLVNCTRLKETDSYAYLEIEETPSKSSSTSEKQVEQAILYSNEDAPLANGIDTSGETLVEDSSSPATLEELRQAIPFICLGDSGPYNDFLLGRSSLPNP